MAFQDVKLFFFFTYLVKQVMFSISSFHERVNMNHLCLFYAGISSSIRWQGLYSRGMMP